MAPGRLQRPKSTRRSKSSRAGLVFPVARITREIKKSQFCKMFRCSVGAGVYTTAVIEYLIAEVLELAAGRKDIERKKRVQPRHVMWAVALDQEMHTLLRNVIIPNAGVVPFIHNALVPRTAAPPAKKRRTGGGAAKPAVPKKRPAASSKPVAKAAAVAGVAATKPPVARPAPPPRQVSYKAGDIVILSEKALHLGQKLTVIKSDIVKLSVDAVVHPTNSTLYTGGQIGQTFVNRGGADFLNEINKVKASGNLAEDAVVITPAFNINARFVLHCNGPSWNVPNCVSRLETTVRNILTVADEKDLRSVAIPSIGSGKAGWPKQTAAETILRSIHGYFASCAQSSIRQIYFVLFDQASIDVYIGELNRLVV